MRHTVKDLIKDKTAIYLYCKSGCLYYSIDVEDLKYTFPVDVTSIEEVGDATFGLEEKAIYLMRYINKSIKNETIRWDNLK